MFKILYCVFTSIFLLISCAKQAEVHLSEGRVKYRKNIDPVGRVTKFSKKPHRPSHNFSQAFSLWRISHTTLVKSLGNGYLAVLENHRRTTGLLLDMGWFLPLWQQHKINDYVKLYENLLRQKHQGVRKRTLARKYKYLQKIIQKDLNRFHPKKK